MRLGGRWRESTRGARHPPPALMSSCGPALPVRGAVTEKRDFQVQCSPLPGFEQCTDFVLLENWLVSASHVPSFFLSVLFTKVSLCFQLIRKAPLIHN